MSKTLKTLTLVIVLALIHGTVYALPIRRYSVETEEVSGITSRTIITRRPAGLESAGTPNPSLLSGKNNCLVILVEFSVEKGTKTASDFDELLFSSGTYSTGSMNDYYREVSYNVMSMSGTVTDWYAVSQERSYYANAAWGKGAYPQNTQGLVEEVLDLVDADINFADYDRDGDGEVDFLVLVVAGYFDRLGLDSNKSYIDPLKFSLSEGGPGAITKDGKTIDDYVIVPERSYKGAHTAICEMGIFSHEVGHLLGLPDLYDTDITGYAEGLGNYCLMANGAYGADDLSFGYDDVSDTPGTGEKPVHPSAWCKVRLGWVTPTLITENVDSQPIRNIENYGDVFKVIANYSLKGNSEYFLIANRQKNGYDSDMFGSGLLIYHVDETAVSNIDLNDIPNNDQNHKYVDLEEADGEEDLDHRNPGDATDFFAGGTSYDSFGSPESNTYPTDFSDSSDIGRKIAFSVSNISVSGNTMTADIDVKVSDITVPTSTRKNIFTPNYDGYNDKVVFSAATGSYTITIYDMVGREVRELSSSNEWDGMDASGAVVDSGVYIYQILFDNGSVTSGTVVVAK